MPRRLAIVPLIMLLALSACGQPAPAGTADEAFIAPANLELAQRIVHDLVVARGGSISAEHGIGQLKRDELARTKAPLELAIMRRIKAALDPAGILNPGKIL